MLLKKIRVNLFYSNMEINLMVSNSFAQMIPSQYSCNETGKNSFAFSSLKDFYQCIDKAHEENK